MGGLPSDSVKAGVGPDWRPALHFLADLAYGTTVINVELLKANGAAPTLGGRRAVDTTLDG